MIPAAQVEEAASGIRRRWPSAARLGLILGTGLDQLAREIDTEVVVPYDDLPRFPQSTAPGHAGRLLCGRLSGCPVAAMDGRCHTYEGYSLEQIVFPVRVLRAIGVECLIVTNACGGLNPQMAAGDVMVLSDHISLMGRSEGGVGPRRAGGRMVRPAASPYDPALIQWALELARREDFVARQGVYIAVTGPNYETRAEYRFLRRIGGDAVGMSTVPEVGAAAACGMRTLALSVVTNVASPDAVRPVDSDEVIAAAARAAANVGKLVRGVATRLATGQ